MATLDRDQFDHEAMDFNRWGRADLAWAAGFIDGDGMVSFYLRNEKHRRREFFVAVRAMNTVRAPLEKLQLMFGGSLCVMRKGHAVYKDSWVWSVTHRRAERVLRALAGHFVVKHDQATAAIEARKLVSADHSRRSPETLALLQQTAERFREMNRKGL